MERDGFLAEGRLEVGPKEGFFVVLDGEHLGELLVRHFGLPEVRGYTDLGRVRVAARRLPEEPG